MTWGSAWAILGFAVLSGLFCELWRTLWALRKWLERPRTVHLTLRYTDHGMLIEAPDHVTVTVSREDTIAGAVGTNEGSDLRRAES